MKVQENHTDISVVLFIIFLVLKLTKLIDWSWWWVTCPLWLWIVILIIIATVLGILKVIFGRYL